MFVAPAPNGDVIGESNGLGWHGPSLHFPESTIRLPSLQFGSLFRSRRGPEMITNQQRASFQSQPALKMQLTRPTPNSSATKHGDHEPDRPNCTVPAAPCFGQSSSPQTEEIVRLQQQVSQLTALVGQLAAMQQGQPQAAYVPQSGVQQVVGYQPTVERQFAEPQRPVPAVPSAAEQRFREQYEQKCRELEGAQQQLAATQWEYQALLEAKQKKIVQERDARMRKQLGEAIEEESAPAKPASAPTASPSRSQPVESNNGTREPLRLRAQTPVTDSRATLAMASERSRNAVEASVSEDRVDATPESVPTGSRLGRWFKASK